MEDTLRQNPNIEIALLKNGAKSSYDSFFVEMKECFTNSKRPLEWKQFIDFQEFNKSLANTHIPHLVFVDCSENSCQFKKASDFKNYFGNLRQLDPYICVLVMMDQVPNSNETMQWLDAGATGLIGKNFKASQLSDALFEVLCKRLDLHVTRKARLPIKHKLQIQLASFEQALAAETLNLGIGGMFVRSVPPEVKVGELIEFEFLVSKQLSGSQDDMSFSEPLLRKMDADTNVGIIPKATIEGIVGTGLVVWVRHSGQADMPEGMGIQFQDLNPTAQKIVENYVLSHRICAYIPKA